MHNSVIVGVAGGSASGKSTLVAALADALEQMHAWRPAILATDSYVNAGAADGPTFFSPSAGEAMFDWNHPRSVDWPRLLRDLGTLANDPAGPRIIFVEGLMVLHDSTLRPYLDIRLFVDLDADVRALRRLLRNMGRDGMNNDPNFIANYYRECARVGHARYVEPSREHADLIVRGDADWTRVGPLLIAMIEDQRTRAKAETIT